MSSSLEVHANAVKELLGREATLNTWMPAHEIFRRMPKQNGYKYNLSTMSRVLNEMFNFEYKDVSENSVDGVYAAVIYKTVVHAPGKKGKRRFYLFSRTKPTSIPWRSTIFQTAWDEYAKTETGKKTYAPPRKKLKTGTKTEECDSKTTREEEEEEEDEEIAAVVGLIICGIL